MLGMTRNSLDDFHFESIGQQPSLLSRFSNAEDAAVQPIPSTSPSPSSSPRASALPVSSSSRLLEALAPKILLTQHELNNDQPSASNPHSEGASTCRGKVSPHLRQVAEPITAAEQPLMIAPVPSHMPSPSFSTQPSPHPSASLPSLTAANVSSAPTGPGSSNLLALGVVLPASISPSLPQGDDALETFRQTLKRLQTEADEFGRREEETRRAAARQQDQAARWHARADAVIDNMNDLFAMAEQRIASAEQRAAQLAHFETKAAQREEELRQLRVALARVEQENATLRRESEEERRRAAEQRRTEDAHVSEVLAKAGNAVKQAESRERERQIEEAHLRKMVEEEQGRREALERELEKLKQQAELDKQTLQMELEESKRIAEQEKQRRMDELVEERRRLEERLAKATAYEAAKTGGRDVPSRQEVQGNTPQHSSSSASPIVTSVPVTTASTSPTHLTTSNTASRKDFRGKDLHLSTEVALYHTSAASDVLAQPPESATNRRTNSPQTACPDYKLGALNDIEPLPPVKDEESDGQVKSELSSPTISSQERHADDGEARKPRREQSLEYANLSQGTVPMMTSLRTSPRIPPSNEAASNHNMTGRLTIPRPPSPPIQFRGRSPETLYAPLILQSSVSQHDFSAAAGHTSQAVYLERSPALQKWSSRLTPSRDPPPYEHNSRDLDERSRAITPPLSERPPPTHQRGNDRPPEQQYPPAYRQPDHYSPSPPPPGLDHWSPPPYRPYIRDDRYSPQVRHKRTRGDDDSPDSPDARRPRLDPTTYDSHPSGPSLAQRIVPWADDSHSSYDHRRDHSPPRRSPRSLSPDARRGYLRDPEHAPNRYAPPPQDRARTPPHPPDHAVNGYAAPEAPTLIHETEVPSSQMAPSIALSPSGSAHAPILAKFADQSKPTHVPKTTTTAARKPPHKQLSPPTVDAGKKLLIDRIGDVAGGASRNGGAAKHLPLVSKHPVTRSANTYTRGGKKGPRGPARAYQDDTRAQSGGSAQSKPLVARIQTSSLQERLS